MKSSEYDVGKRPEQRGKITTDGTSVVTSIGGLQTSKEDPAMRDPINEKDPQGIEIGCEEPEWK